MVDCDPHAPLVYDALFSDVMSYAECCVESIDLTFEDDMSDCDEFVCRALVEESLGNADWHDLPGLIEIDPDFTIVLDDDDLPGACECGPFQFCQALVDEISWDLDKEKPPRAAHEPPSAEKVNDGNNTEELPRKQPRRRSSHIRAERFGIAPVHYRNLRRYGAPLALFHLLAHICDMNGGPMARDLWMADMYAGEGAVSKAFRSAGFTAAEFEILRSPTHMNSITPTGLMVACIFGLRLAPGGLSSWGTVCTSFIFVSQPQCRRSAANPLGDLRRPEVRAGNQMVSRMVMVILLILVRGGQWLLEQPGSSRMALLPRMQWLLNKFQNYETRTWMGAFGGPTWKPTLLRSSSAWVYLMRRFLTADDKQRFQGHTTCRKSWDPIQEKWQVTGKLKELKESQVYPDKYGMAMLNFWKNHTDRTECIHDADSSDSDGYVEDEVPENWEDLGDIEGIAALTGYDVHAMP